MKYSLLLLALTYTLCGFAQSDNIVTIYFDFNSSEISTEEQEKIDALKKRSGSTAIISLTAHTDSTGSQSYNLKLAERRLNAVASQFELREAKTSSLGEREANKASTYIDSKFRKVDILYGIVPDISDESHGTVTRDPEPTLKNGITDFIESEDTDLSFDLSVHFIPGKAVPLPESYDELRQLAEIMSDHPTLNAFLHGHVCCSNNLVISERRAEYVYLYLIKQGINKDRLEHMGHGNTQLKVAPDLTEADHIQNRRVNVVFTKK